MTAETYVGPTAEHLAAAPSFENAERRYVGRRIPRRDDRRLVTGHGMYVDDVRIPDCLHLHFIRSDVASARIVSIDASAALELEGVVAVFTGEDFVVPEGSMGSSLAKAFRAPGGQVPADLPMARGFARYVGDPVAAVVATSRYLAEDAAELVEVTYEDLAPVVDYESAADRTEIVNAELGTNVAGTMEKPPTDDHHALVDGAAHLMTATFRQHRQTNVPMETRGVVADYDPTGDELTVWISSQGPHEIRRRCVELLGMDEARVRVVQRDVGGGFGQKMIMLREEIATVLAAHRLGRPVRWIEDRRENLMAANIARIEKGTITFALDDDGRILATTLEHVEDAGAGSEARIGPKVCMWLTGPYKVQSHAFKTTAYYTNTVGRAAYRAPWQMESVIREEMADHVARKLGIDPLEFRRRNVFRWEDLPYTMPTGIVIDIATPAETLEQAAELIGYDAFRAEQRRAFEQDGRLLGIGIGLYVEPSAQNLATFGSEGATIRLGTTGKVDLYLGTGDHGQGITTTMAQIAADELGLTLDDITVHQGDTAQTPFGAGTGGSRTASIVSGATAMAARELRAKIVAVAAHLFEADPADIETHDSLVMPRGTPAISMKLGELAAKVFDAPTSLPADLDVNLEASTRFRQVKPTYSNGCHSCTVEVDPRTGRTTILRYVVSEDCGRMINPNTVEGQTAGGALQGIGGVLYEHLVYDDLGNPLATTFMDYLIPTASEAPDFEFGHVETPSDTPGGFKGMAEGPCIGSPPAVFNAVADALAQVGAVVFDHPLGPRQILDALDAAVPD